MSIPHVRIITNETECLKLYKLFCSTPATLFDDLEFRLAFHQAYNYPLFFVLLEEEQQPTALLPLCFNTDMGQYQWWGTNWMENTALFIDKEKTLGRTAALKQAVFAAAPRPLHLEGYQSDPDIEALLQPAGARYFLNIQDCPDWEAYLQIRSSKTRKKLRHNIAPILEAGTTLETGPELFDELLKLNAAKFNIVDNDGSSFADPRRLATYQNILANPKLETHVFGSSVDHYLRTVSIGVRHGDTLVLLNSGTDYHYSEFVGLLTLKTEIEYAHSLGVTYMDYMSEAPNQRPYKAHLHFESEALFELTLTS